MAKYLSLNDLFTILSITNKNFAYIISQLSRNFKQLWEIKFLNEFSTWQHISEKELDFVHKGFEKVVKNFPDLHD